MAIVNVKDLQEGDILAIDIYRGETLMLKSGSPLTKKNIHKLIQWNISSVEINNDQDDVPNDETTTNENYSVPSVLELKRTFLKTLADIGHEYRYGIALYESKDYQWLESLFIKLMSNTTIYNYLKKIQEWDFYTYQHSLDVFILGSLFAKKLNLSNIESFSTGCLLHDVGKLKIPKKILKKPSGLNSTEYNLIKNHTIFGYQIMKKLNFSEDIANLAKSHHERINGSGYPKGLKTTEIKTEVKLLSIVDVYSALTLNRPYREAYGSPNAQRILLNECKVVDDYYFHKFFQMLDIFPLDTIVELTNGTQAKIIEINDKIPHFPTLKNIYDTNKTKIPLNRSIKVKKIIKL